MLQLMKNIGGNKMKKVYLGLFLFVSFTLVGCANNSETSAETTATSTIETTTVTSSNVEKIEIPADDKYNKHVKNYVGRNASAVGSERMNGTRMESFGYADLPIAYITENGEAITEDNIADYKIISQEPAPGTAIVLTYAVDESGAEYDNVVDSTSINELVLHLEKIEKE